MPIIQGRSVMTQRERDEFEQEKTFAEMQSALTLELKQKELEVARLEAKWASWTRIPITLIKLPVLVVLAVGYCIAVAKKVEPSQNFWDFLNK